MSDEGRFVLEFGEGWVQPDPAHPDRRIAVPASRPGVFVAPLDADPADWTGWTPIGALPDDAAEIYRQASEIEPWPGDEYGTVAPSVTALLAEATVHNIDQGLLRLLWGGFPPLPPRDTSRMHAEYARRRRARQRRGRR